MSSGDVFIVDDTPANLDLLAAILRDSGYDVRVANSGRRALRVVSAHPPDLVMLDIQMPEMDGYEVCRQLKADPATSAIPVIFISALDDVFDKVRAFRAGGVDYVAKPFQAEEVLARVETQLELVRLRRELEHLRRERESKT
jgi:PleD family two-component response regulator